VHQEEKEVLEEEKVDSTQGTEDAAVVCGVGFVLLNKKHFSLASLASLVANLEHRGGGGGGPGRGPYPAGKRWAAVQVRFRCRQR